MTTLLEKNELDLDFGVSNDVQVLALQKKIDVAINEIKKNESECEEQNTGVLQLTEHRNAVKRNYFLNRAREKDLEEAETKLTAANRECEKGEVILDESRQKWERLQEQLEKAKLAAGEAQEKRSREMYIRTLDYLIETLSNLESQRANLDDIYKSTVSHFEKTEIQHLGKKPDHFHRSMVILLGRIHFADITRQAEEFKKLLERN